MGAGVGVSRYELPAQTNAEIAADAQAAFGEKVLRRPLRVNVLWELLDTLDASAMPTWVSVLLPEARAALSELAALVELLATSEEPAHYEVTRNLRKQLGESRDQLMASDRTLRQTQKELYEMRGRVRDARATVRNVARTFDAMGEQLSFIHGDLELSAPRGWDGVAIEGALHDLNGLAIEASIARENMLFALKELTDDPPV